MPAERTRGSKRNNPGGVQLTWTTPIDPSTAQSIAFTPTITPDTFLDPPADSPSAESMLFPPMAESTSSSRRSGHTKKKPENHIPRPPNAFILFRSSFIKSQHVSSDVETNHSTLSKIIGLTWQNLPHEERQIWHMKAKVALEEHKRKFPQYAFRPLHSKGKGATEKRKVRETGPKDLKRCTKIAELLVEGKKGVELETAIAEFDRHHVPEIVTRFEAPITARSYRRSSSAPAPNTEHSKPSFLPSRDAVQVSKRRASSTAPEYAYAPTDTSSECSTPSAELEPISPTEYYSDSPFSPLDSPSVYTLPDTNPSFDFCTFSFAPSSPVGLEICDPLSQAASFDFCDVFSQSSSPSPAPMQQTFTSYLPVNPYPSPLSSMPGTPLDTAPHDFSPMTRGTEGISAPYSDFGSFFANPSAFSDALAPMNSPVNPALSNPEFFPTTKPNFACYDTPNLGSYEDLTSQVVSFPNYTL